MGSRGLSKTLMGLGTGLSLIVFVTGCVLALRCSLNTHQSVTVSNASVSSASVSSASVSSASVSSASVSSASVSSASVSNASVASASSANGVPTDPAPSSTPKALDYVNHDITAANGSVSNTRYEPYQYDTFTIHPQDMVSANITCTGVLDPDSHVSVYEATCTAGGESDLWSLSSTSSGIIDTTDSFVFEGGGSNCMCVTLETGAVVTSGMSFSCVYTTSDEAWVEAASGILSWSVREGLIAVVGGLVMLSVVVVMGLCCMGMCKHGEEEEEMVSYKV
ncbi:hypothetical protein KIPB_000026 [Kipferlia bialata]|uniref:Uncharacterized protein n=1 Tax=Kipferlia bialata TaxID=797122 RepID=A0A9K3CLF0_9EUKA|nr:hypothetical protein KIPB_000026 [Kipferlia bialata]|eukprot:g26.t1